MSSFFAMEPMIHEILPVGPLQCNCSVVGDEITREAMVIDPGDEIEEIVAILRRHNLHVNQIVITHAVYRCNLASDLRNRFTSAI
jgi:glyoxylase-like metal-dependent hydrolase (beta-lactamase superfamily II)